jgi:hypothetical protein
MTQPTSAEAIAAGLVEWANDRSAEHHALAVENEHLRTEHIASSSAYRRLAEELPAILRHILQRNPQP